MEILYVLCMVCVSFDDILRLGMYVNYFDFFFLANSYDHESVALVHPIQICTCSVLTYDTARNYSFHH